MSSETTVTILDESNGLEFEAYGFIYITTNNLNGRRYIGSKVFSYPDGNKNSWNSYLGSGKALKNAIEKYGKENFSRDIIYVASSMKELEQMETYYILIYNAAYSKEYYNIKAGSNLIGNPYAGKSEEEMLEIKKKISKSSKEKWKNGTISTEERKAEIRTKIGNSNKKIWDRLSPEDRASKIAKMQEAIVIPSFTGKEHSEETRKLMSEIALERFSKMESHYLYKEVFKYTEEGVLLEVYKSLNNACESLIGIGKITNINGAKSAIKRSVDNGEIIHGFRFSYGSFDEVNNKDKKRVPRKGKPIEVIDTLDNSSVIFENFMDAVIYLERDYSVVYKRFQRGTLLDKRYRIIRYVPEDKIKEEVLRQINK